MLFSLSDSFHLLNVHTQEGVWLNRFMLIRAQYFVGTACLGPARLTAMPRELANGRNQEDSSILSVAQVQRAFISSWGILKYFLCPHNR